jgi:hypothetical protein
MIVFIGMGLLIGGLLGARFTVVALLPAAGLSLGIAGVAWLGPLRAPGWSPVDLLALLTFLQVGYLCGAGLRLSFFPRVVPESHGNQEVAQTDPEALSARYRPRY